MPRADGKGQVLATEILIATPAIRKHIRDGNTHLIFSELQTGKKHQMVTMDSALLELYQRGDITYDVAISSAKQPESIRQRTA